jgi:sugar/nucleoside kinase (ribokinase family)
MAVIPGLTLGAQRAFGCTLDQMVHVPAFPGTVVETMAAGDAFNGALAVVHLATHCPGCGNPLPPPGVHACPRCGLAGPAVQR